MLNGYKTHPIWLHPETRLLLAETYHLNAPADYQVAQYFLLDGWRNRDDEVVIPVDTFRRLSGNKYAGWRDIWELPYTSYSEIGQRGYRNTVVGLYIPDEVDKALREETRKRRERDGMVEFVSGELWTAYKERKEKEEELKMLDEYTESLEGCHTYELVKYLHSPRTRKALKRVLDRNYFNIEYALDRATRENERRASRILRHLERHVNAYAAKERTDRIYAETSLMPKEVREAALAGCWSLDLKSAQLRIIAKLWNLPEIDAIPDVWQYLYNELGVTEQKKPDLKRMLYIICYGGGRETMLERAEKGKMDGSLIDPFLALPLVQTIQAARDREVEKLMGRGFIEDAWGDRYFLKDVDAKNIYQAACSLLGRQGQSYEMKLMLAAFDVIAADDDLVLILWLHDGCYLDVVHHKQNAEHKLNMIQSAVADMADRLGINTQLDIQRL